MAAGKVSHNIVVLFFDRLDDRDAISYTIRMSKSPRNTLNVTRFILRPGSIGQTTNPSNDGNDPQGILALQIIKKKENKIDDKYIKEFKMTNASDESFSYIEKVVNNGVETVETTTACEGRGGGDEDKRKDM
ncbi:hypothetical protein U1Q18_023168 [Sarracenia purpurea var. burkii]